MANVRFDFYKTRPIEEVREKYLELDSLAQKAKETGQSGAQHLFSYGKQCLAEILIERGDEVEKS